MKKERAKTVDEIIAAQVAAAAEVGEDFEPEQLNRKARRHRDEELAYYEQLDRDAGIEPEPAPSKLKRAVPEGTRAERAEMRRLMAKEGLVPLVERNPIVKRIRWFQDQPNKAGGAGLKNVIVGSTYQVYFRKREKDAVRIVNQLLLESVVEDELNLTHWLVGVNQETKRRFRIDWWNVVRMRRVYVRKKKIW